MANLDKQTEDRTNSGYDKTKIGKNLNSTNPRHHTPWTQQTLDKTNLKNKTALH
jgi:hypothetical protein